MTTLLAALIGLAAGLHAATWGMYKDAPHEGFTWGKYARSPVLASFLGVMLQALTGLDPFLAADVVRTYSFGVLGGGRCAGVRLTQRAAQNRIDQALRPFAAEDCTGRDALIDHRIRRGLHRVEFIQARQ